MWKGVWDANKKSLTLEIILKAVLLAENLGILSGTLGGGRNLIQLCILS